MAEARTWAGQVRQELRHALAYTSGNKREAARLLGVSPTTLYELMCRHGVTTLVRMCAAPKPVPLRILRRIAFEIALLRADGVNKAAALELDVHPSTVSRQRKERGNG